MNLSANHPVVIAARRSAIGRSGGMFRDFSASDLAAPVFAQTLADSGAGVQEVAELFLGNVCGPGGNLARSVALSAGLGIYSSAVTVDRQCASGLEAVHMAASMIMAGRGDVYLAGGVESASTAPLRAHRPISAEEELRFYSRASFAPQEFGDPDMGAAADVIAAGAQISRESQDDYAAESHRRAMESIRSGTFDSEIVAIHGHRIDERPRSGLTPARLSRLRPAFTPDGTATAGNSCGVNDGAAALAIAGEQWCDERKLTGLSIVDWQSCGFDPSRPGLSPVPAVRSLLSRHNLRAQDIDVVEFNEAFAGQVLACLSLLDISPDVVCPEGGALALGHPWGASGAVLMVRLFSQLVLAGKGKWGLAVIASGGGQGLATLVTPYPSR